VFEFDGTIAEPSDVLAKRKCPIHEGMSDVDAMKHVYLALCVVKSRYHVAMGVYEIDDGDGGRISALQPDMPTTRGLYGHLPVGFYAVAPDGSLEFDLPNHTDKQRDEVDAAVAADALFISAKEQLPQIKTPQTKRA
jgi:hypothetical protein